MKGTSTSIFLLSYGFILAALGSCNEEEGVGIVTKSSTVQFTETQIVISENQKKTITLKLNTPAQQAGSVSIVLSSDQLAKFVTDPAHTNGRIDLPVSKGNTTLSFLLKPVNDTRADGNKVLSVSISEVSSGFQIGTNHSLSVSVIDDEPVDNRVEANFLNNQHTLNENTIEGLTITIGLSAPAPASGLIGIVYSSDHIGYGIEIRYGIDFITEPAAENGKITLAVGAGSNQVNFKVIPINNQVWLGNRSMVFTLTNGQGSIRLGQGVVLQLNINDDEPAPKIIGYETVGGGWKVKRQYEYGYDNNLAKITWEQYTPSYLGGTYNYVYHNGRLHKMVENANRETYYLWEGDRIVKEEEYTNGLLSKYVLYHYDEAGNIGEAAFYYRQRDGSIKMGFLFVYLYFTDGNLYKKMVYYPIEGTDEYSLISTSTYEHYLDIDNPFPLEILPNVNSQPKLPGSYREEANGHNTLYNFFYEFDGSGRPLKRTASSTMGTEVTTYKYR